LTDAVSKKEIQGFVVQNPFKMDYLGVKTMIDHLEGRRFEKDINTEVM